MVRGVKMLIRENKIIKYLIKKGLIKKIICYYILVVILLSSIALASSEQIELKIPAPKIKDNTSTTSSTESKDDSSSTSSTESKDDSSITSSTESKDDSSSTSSTESKDDSSSTSTTEIKDIEGKYIDSAVEWLNDNYDTTNNNNISNVSHEKIEINVEKDIGNITTGEKIIVKTEKSEQVSIDSLEFVPSTDLKKVKFTVAKLKDKPEEIVEEPIENGSIYVYLDIKLTSNDTYLNEEEFESMKFGFKVEKTWIHEKNIDKDTITLVRYHEEWQYLITNLIREDEIYIYYESETPGLSTYTVVGTQIIEASPALVKEKTILPLTGWIAIISFSSIVLIGVVYKLRFVYKSE
jgi:PGF-pre-PGF domain-containing protein